MKIFFDLDGCLTDFTSNLITVANSLWPGKMPPDYIPTNWNYTDVLTKQEFSEIWDEIHKIPNFWLRQKPYEENVSVLRSYLKTTQDEVYYITSRMDTGGVSAEKQTQTWLRQNGLFDFGCPKKLIVVTKPSEKKQWVEARGIDASLDDYVPTVASLNVLPWHHSYLLSRPWNPESTLTRVNSVQEFLEQVDHLRI